MTKDGLPEKRAAVRVIGAPSLYGRGRNSPAITTASRGARLTGVAYDPVYQRIFARDYTEIAWQPYGRILVFDANPTTMKDGEDAIAVFGQPDFTSYRLGGIGPQKLGSIDGTVLDIKNQRLIITDKLNNRVMVWDVRPDHLTPTPQAIAVLGQPDFMSKTPGLGPDHFNGPHEIYYDADTDRLFVADVGNNRVLVFDTAPDRLKTGMAASEVLGQPDFRSNKPGTAADRFTQPSGLAYDHRFRRLFIVDGSAVRGGETGQTSDELLERSTNSPAARRADSSAEAIAPRLLVFDGSPAALRTGAKAVHVLGQSDFASREPRTNLKKWSSGLLVDSKSQRLFANEAEKDRMLIFDIHPDRLKNNPDATNLMFAKDWETGFGPNAPARGLGIVSRTEETSVKDPLLDEENQLLYTADSYTGRNGDGIWDISPDRMKGIGTPAIDVLGQYDWGGNVDFTARGANGRANDRFVYPRGVALDPVDHRLFVNDQYMHRVVVFDLDHENRPLDRKADVILGQPDAYTSQIRQMSDRDMNIPLALAYDSVGKHLFVADGGNNRILVFDADPKRLKTYGAAIAVIGQPDFTSRRKDVGARGVNLGVAFGRGITSTAPLPMGFAIDQKRQRLFLSDGMNHRILVYDIGSGKIQSGMAATAVIGQPDFKTNTSRADGGGFNVPSDLAYDSDHDRLFAVDGMNSRVLVFNAAPADIKPGQKAIVVLGQGDFTSTKWVRLDSTQVSDDVGRRRMRMPSGIAYDRVRQQLYVNDKGNDRVLIFDAAPDKLDSDAPATGVIGQPDFVTRIAGDGEQEQLLDPRQLAFDSENQRLYVADSFWGRLMMFDMPRSERRVALDGHSMKSYGTLDAWNNRTQPEDLRWGKPKDDKQEAWRASLQSDSSVLGATLVYYNTRQMLDPKSLRRYRILISETSLTAPKQSRSELFSVNKDGNNDTRVVVSNPNAETARVQFRLKNGAKSLEVARTLAPGAQLDATMSELFGRDVEGTGTLRVRSEVDVTSFVLQQATTARGEKLLVAGLGGALPETGDSFVIPDLKWGGGYQSELVLLNPHDKAIEGRVAFYDGEGQAVGVADNGSNRLSYKIEPDGAFRWVKRSPSVWPTEVYAVIEDAGDAPPTGGAVVSVWKESLLLTERAVPVRSVTHLAWAPMDTEPSLIRHGRSQISFTIANPTRTPALLRFTLFDSEGKERGRYEQVLPPNLQDNWTLGDLFNIQEFRGTVRLWSDVAVGVSIERTTRSMRGEPVEDHISYLTEESLKSKRRVELPQILDGQGMATEVILINPVESRAEANWTFFSPDGKIKEIVLR